MSYRVIIIIARILLGLGFLLPAVLSLTGMVHQPELPPAPAAFIKELAATNYMMPLLFGTQLIGAVLLLSGFFVPFALVLLAPLIVNIFAFHLFLEPSGLAMAIAVAVLEVFLAWSYREAFAPLFSTPAAGKPAGREA
jgi:uncharacterized membrane protein YphA (DoxX/SURF4 family)